MKLRAVPGLVLLAGHAAGCAGFLGAPTGGGASSSSGGIPDAGPTCTAAPVPLAFVDRTVEWGLDALQVRGNRLATADLDEDGYPDLVVHRVFTHRRTDFAADAGPASWGYRVLMNRAGSGGRVFEDATQASGYGATRDGAGQGRNAQFAIMADLDGDGHLDAFSGTYVDPNAPTTDPGDRSEILLGDGQGHFTLGPALPAPMQGINTVSAATVLDWERDGKLDVYVGNWYERYGSSYAGMQNLLLANSGGGTFYNATGIADLTTTRGGFTEGTNHRPTYGVTACDLNDDGQMDLLDSSYGRQLNQLWLQQGFLFTDQGGPSGFASDADQDFTTNEFYRCYCRATGACSAPPPVVQCPAGSAWDSASDEQPWRLGGNTFTTVCADFTGDGRMDLYNAEIHHWWAGTSSDSSELLVMDHLDGAVPVYTRPGAAVTGLSIPHPTSDWNEGGLMAAAGDLDNDGRLDLVAAFSDYPDQFGLVYRQRDDGTFEEVGAAAGLHHACMSGLTLADLDRDGDLDVIAGSSTARDCAATWTRGPEVRVYENVSGNAGSWVQLLLEGTTANRSAIGARVQVEAGGTTQVRFVEGGHGHAGMQHDRVVHAGLASACTASATIRWPDEALGVQQIAGLVAGRRYKVVQGADPVEVP